jgi:hypothetical protein
MAKAAAQMRKRERSLEASTATHSKRKYAVGLCRCGHSGHSASHRWRGTRRIFGMRGRGRKRTLSNHLRRPVGDALTTTGPGHLIAVSTEANQVLCVFCKDYQEIWCSVQNKLQPVVLCKRFTNSWCYVLFPRDTTTCRNL